MKVKKDVEGKRCVTVAVECPGLDQVIEKANRLVELLREASAIIDSLTARMDQNPN